MAPYMGLRGTGLTVAIGLVSGLCFALYGYDQADAGSLLTVASFRRQFPQLDTIANPGNRHIANIQGITIAAWNLGCIISSICTIWLGSYLGRRKTIFVGICFLAIGEIIQCTSFSLGQFIAGRVIAGFGNGFNTSTVPAWQAETSRAHRRGMLVMITGTFIALGSMFAYWMAFAFAYLDPSSAAWRVPIAIQLAVALIVLVMVIFLPESPRWLILSGRAEEALRVLGALDNADASSAIVLKEFLAIKDAVISSNPTSSFSDVFTNDKPKGSRHFHRTLIACAVQLFQQISGVNLISQYIALLLLTQMGYAPWVSRLLAGCLGIATVLASLVPVIGIDRFWGRRSLMMFGATGMLVSMIVLAITRSVSNHGSNIAATVFFFVFECFFVIGWQGMAWLYSAEIAPLRIRAPANALSTAVNWIANFVVVMITPIAFNNIGYRTYIIFAVFNACIIPAVYFLFPETSFRTLEEVDVFFYTASKTKTPYFSVVKQSHEAPLWYGRDGHNEFDYEKSEWHQRHIHGSDEQTSSSGGDWRTPNDQSSDEKKSSGNGAGSGGSGSGSGSGSVNGTGAGAHARPANNLTGMVIGAGNGESGQWSDNSSTEPSSNAFLAYAAPGQVQRTVSSSSQNPLQGRESGRGY